MGLESIDHGPADLEARIILDANRASQEIGVFLDDSFHFEEQRGVYVQPFVTTNVSVTQGAMTITINTGSATWMIGCTIQIAGSSVYNRLRKTAAGAFELARPFLGTTGASLAATIWHDSVELPADVMRVEGPFKYGADDLGVVDSKQLRSLLGDTRTPGTPTVFAEVSVKSGDEAPHLALLLNQLPAGNAEISYTATGRIAAFADLNDTRVHVVPFDLEASVLMPIFLFYLSSYRLFAQSKQEAAAEYQLAQRALARLPTRSAAPKRLVRPKR